MNATEELDTAGRLAREVEEIAKIEASLNANPDAQRSLADLRVRLIDLQPTVRLSVAADLLEISLPTLRAWMKDGPLREAEGSSPRRVSLDSVLEVRPVLRDLRALGRDRNLLAAVIHRLEDERDLADPVLQRSLEEMRRGDLIDVTASRRRELSS
jgi:DNA-binding transcriptional MerR regulator